MPKIAKFSGEFLLKFHLIDYNSATRPPRDMFYISFERPFNGGSNGV